MNNQIRYELLRGRLVNLLGRLLPNKDSDADTF